MDRAAFQALARQDTFPKVSVYVATGPHGSATLQAPIRAKNALRHAAEGLVDRGAAPAAVGVLLEAARERLDDPARWLSNGGGFAVFAGEEGTRVESQLGAAEELVVVGDRYHLRPYLAAMEQDDRYDVLAIARGGFRFYRGEGAELEPVDVSAPAGSVGEVRSQYAFDDDLGWHPSMHDFDDVVLDQFVSGVAKAVAPLLEDDGRLLVLAGGPREVGWLRHKLGRVWMAEEVVHRNVGRQDAADLGPRAWAIAEPLVRAARTELVERLDRSLAGGGVPGSRNLHAIARAAVQGRVDLLFVDPTLHVWGSIDAEAELTLLDERRGVCDEDLLNFVSLAAWRTGGTVLPLPEDRRASAGPASATFRW